MGLLIQSIKRTSSKIEGNTAYLYRPETINPARIYVMMDWDSWKAAKTRPLGLVDQVPLVIRPMTEAEIELCGAQKYLSFHSFDTWEDLMAREMEMGVPVLFQDELQVHYRNNFKLKSYVAKLQQS